MNSPRKIAILFLKVGVAFAFLYPAFSALFNPNLWVGYVPSWVDLFVSREIFLFLFSVSEIFVGLGVLFINRAYPAIIAGLILLTIVAFNPGEFPVIFRDLSIACMAFALAFLTKPR